MYNDYGTESSEQLNELFAALAKAQGDFPLVVKTKDNPYFKSKHEGIDDIMNAVRKPLKDNGLAVTQDLYTCAAGKEVLKTTITHASGQWRSAALILKPAKTDQHSLASATTYIRRTMLKAMLGIAVTNDTDDDDGNKASGRDVEKKRMLVIKLQDIIEGFPNSEYLLQQVLTKTQKEELGQLTEEQLMYFTDIFTKKKLEQK